MLVTNVHHLDHANDAALREHAKQRARAIYEAAGAREAIPRGPFPSTHKLGACRQSANPHDGVCNKFGQTHDIKNLFISDGSQFTTSAAENPTLTIVALAIRQADYITEQMAKQGI
jgi:choline dehydrogenase-like flavoprotein